MRVNENAEGTKSLRHFRRWGGLCARTRKKKVLFYGIFANAWGLYAHTRKKKALFSYEIKEFQGNGLISYVHLQNN